MKGGIARRGATARGRAQPLAPGARAAYGRALFGHTQQERAIAEMTPTRPRDAHHRRKGESARQDRRRAHARSRRSSGARARDGAHGDDGEHNS